MIYARYEAAKAAWLAKNPQATSKQIEEAFSFIAKRLGI
jgi:hypothetical protein